MAETIPKLCGSVAGAPSPLGVKMHDAAYAALGLDFKYLAIGASGLAAVIGAAKVLDFHGLGVSMPFKGEIIGHLDEVTEEVQAIGACNTVVFRDGALVGYNTDWRGAMAALEEAGLSEVSSATIVGGGGVARAIAYGLKKQGVEVFVSARAADQRRALCRELNLAGECDLQEQGKYNTELVVNATPLAGADSPVELDAHGAARGLLDVVFQQLETELGEGAKSRSWKVASGWRMLLHQALGQFKLYTGKDAPVDAMSSILSDALS